MYLLSKDFSTTLFEWHLSIDRPMPWKREKDVFLIWLSEIILQQTRVEQGIPYFLKFKDRFNSVHELARASDEEVMKLWEGLGYYSRARNMHSTAKTISANGGIFPDSYEGLLKLKGVGPYTAAAIASFAYGLPVPVIDGNVYRIISRIYGVLEPIDTQQGKQIIDNIVQKIFDVSRPADFNQAIMDFGALQCKPKNPDCAVCPFSEKCHAYQNELVNTLPQKSKSVNRKKRFFHYFIVEHNDSLLIRKRSGKDIWKHLHDFVLIESENASVADFEDRFAFIAEDFLISKPNTSKAFRHLLTHQELIVFFHTIHAKRLKMKKGTEYFLVERKNLRKFAFPKIIDWYLNNK